MKILDFGSCNVDLVYSVNHIVQPGETLAADSMSKFPGGKGLNQAIAIARAGAPIYFAGCVGEDDKMLVPLLRASGVDTTYLKTVKEPTGQAIIQVDQKGENSIIIYQGANGVVTCEHMDSVLENFEAGDILLIQNEISNIPYLIQKASEKKMKIILNPSPFEEWMRSIDLDDLYCVILNETEAGCMSGTGQPLDFLTLVQRKHPRLDVILTLGRQGSIYLKDGKLYRQQAFKVKPVDTTGAGDTFTGYFIAGLYRGEETVDVLCLATAASAVAISKEGAASSIPYLEEVKAAVDSMIPNSVSSILEQKQLVQTFLAEHIADVKLGDVAILLNYSEDYTGRWIRKNFEMNFSELLQRERCCIAADYLRNTELSVGEIIRLVGYQNESFFRTIFTKQYGMMPLEYRKKVIKQCKL